ncbi:MAG TPA: peptidoglycan-associated lipoprotein Pal [Stellaceae bacterium]|nr:peptidoglycan-associated lipoprotein Pal [Stellaceae bacterium]
MNFKTLSLVAALLLVAGCAQKGTEGANTSGAGSGAGTSSAANSTAALTSQLQQVGDRIYFAFDKSDITPESRQILSKQADLLKQNPSVTVTIEGHCDERGTREYNLGLGERRANATKQALVALGIAANRINTISYGKERPAVLGHNEQAWAQNRRAVTVIQ